MPSKRQALNDHEQECQHRDVLCPTLQCSKKVSALNLSFHFKVAHVATKELKSNKYQGTLPFKPEDLKRPNFTMIWSQPCFILYKEKIFYLEFIRTSYRSLFAEQQLEK